MSTNNKFFMKVNKGVEKTLNGIEWLGNRIPKPFFLFVYLIIGLIIISFVLSLVFPYGITLQEIYDPVAKEVVAEYDLEFFNLLGGDGIIWWLQNFIGNFMNFPTTGIVLLITVFVAVAEKSGFITVALKKVAISLPKKILTPACIFLGCISSLAADAGYLILIPLAGSLYYSAGRHPITGITAVFAGVAGGFATSLIPGNTEFLLSSLTNAFLKDPNFHITPLSTYFITTFLLVIFVLVGWWVTEKIVDKRVMAHYPLKKDDELVTGTKYVLTSEQRNGMIFVLIFTLVYLLGIILMTVIPEAPFNGLINHNPDKPSNNLLHHLALIIGILFFGIGIIYGFVAKTFTKKDDIVNALVEGFKKAAPSLILFLIMTQFIKAFQKTRIDTVLGYFLGKGIASLGQPVLILFLFIIIVSIINLFIGSMSAKWGILGPVFILALKEVNIHPATVMAGYRIADGATNMISPLIPYFPLILLWTKDWLQPEQKEKFELGSLMSLMFPYSMTFLLTGIVVFLVWVGLEIPVGVDGPVYIKALSASKAEIFHALSFQKINIKTLLLSNRI